MIEAPTITAPHAHARNSVRRTMGEVLLALTPLTLFGLYSFGWPAVFLYGVTASAAVLAEAACLGLAGRRVWPEVSDGSALLTGCLLALTLPPWAPWWIGVVGSVLAIGVAKHAFGGIGQNVFNPAMMARVALLVSFPVEMTRFIEPIPILSPNAPGFFAGLAITFGGVQVPDALTGATALGQARALHASGPTVSGAPDGHYEPLQLLFGDSAGSLGEGCIPLVLLGGLWLIYRGVVTWHIPASMLLALVASSAAYHLIDPVHHPDPFFHVISGAAVFAAFFIATDLVTSPVTTAGQLLFGAGCGVLVFVLRTASSYPEGVAFAVMLMNACAPLIDHYVKPRIFGRNRRGEPLPYRASAEGHS